MDTPCSAVPKSEASPSVTGSGKLILLQTLVLIGAGLAIFSTALHGDWLWDDNWLITGNETLRSWHGLWQIWFAPPGPDYWPLTSTLLWAGWNLWGAAPLGYHLCNIVLHLLSGMLIWRLLSRLGLRWAWLGGLFFVIHPLAVESVAWMSEIKNTLSLPFFLLSLDAWLDAEEGKSNGYIRSILYYLAAMLAKTSVVMLPAVLLLHCWWKRGGITRHEVWKMIPYFAITLTLGLITLHFQSHMLNLDIIKAREGLSRLALPGTAIFFYFGKFLLPIGLLPIYPHWKLDAFSFFELLKISALTALFWGLWSQRQSWGRHALLGLGFFVLTLAPVIGLFNMTYMNVSWVADHFMYLPMIGLIGLTVAGLETTHQKFPRMARPGVMGAVAAMGFFLAWENHAYAGKFINQETLWSYTLQFNSTCKEAHTNLGNVLFETGRLPEALEHYEAAALIDPHYLQAQNNMGLLLEKLGRIPAAMVHYKEALRINPNCTLARKHLARLTNLQKFVLVKDKSANRG